MEGKPKYEFTREQEKWITIEDRQMLVNMFQNYDKNQDGSMDKSELIRLLADLGERNHTEQDIAAMLKEHDKDMDGVLSWAEFVVMRAKPKSQIDLHPEERSMYARVINEHLKDDEDVSDRIPVNTEDDSFYHLFDNGVVLCKLMMLVDPECIDSRSINRKKDMNLFDVKANTNMALAAAKANDIRLVGVDSTDIIKKTPHLVLTVIWQLLRKIVAKKITLQDCQELWRLKKDDNEDLSKLPADQILLRWINFHLKAAGQDKEVKNLGKDLSDSTALFYVLNQLDKEKCPLDGIDDSDLTSRAGKMIANSAALGVPDLAHAKDITAGNTKVNTLFVAEIFNTKHGLEELDEKLLEEFKKFDLEDDDIEGSKEERVFRFWINSLNLKDLNGEDIYINDLFTEFNDGLLLCKLIDFLKEGAIDWKKIEKKPDIVFKKDINNGTAVKACKESLGLKMIGIGGSDLTKGNRKLILATVWQLVRLHYLKLIGGKDDAEIVKWANDTVGGKATSIKDLSDKSLSDGKFLLHLCAAVEPRAVDWSIMNDGDTEEDKCQNAKYTISVARQLGAIIFCVWEDIVHVNKKQMLIFMSSMADVQKQPKKE